MKHIIKTIVLVSIVLILLPLIPEARAAEEPPEIVEETFTPLDDDTMDGLGYLAVQAMPPEGFSGNICVDIRKQGIGARMTIELAAWEDYYTGVWLPVGNYQVVSGYIPEGDHFTVSWDVDEISLSQDTDAALMISVTSDGSTEAEISGKLETYSPATVPEETEAPAEPETTSKATAETTPETTAAGPTTESRPEKPAVFSARQLLINVLATAIFGGMVFLGAYIFRKYRENKD